MTPSPPADAPNVLLVLIDDAGFGNPGTFGGPVDTPAMSRVAEAGLSHHRFHVTALCSPTRAALLTGRNHHSVGFGSIGELPGPFPGYTAARPKDCAPFVRMLQGNGDSTGGFGKWHMTPDHVQGAACPFDRWPNSWGFDHFWGFGRRTGEYSPVITQDNTVIGVPEGKDGREYYVPDDLTDKAVGWLHAVRAQDPVKPWFLYYSTGCSHAPHQVSAEWSDKYRGRFDDGWDAYREQTFARQKQLGVIPATPSSPRGRTRSRPGTRSRPTRRSSTPGRWRSTPVPGERRLERGPPAGCGRRDGRTRRHPRHLHLGRQRRQHGGHCHRLVQRAHHAKRHPAHHRPAALADRPIRRPGRLGLRQHRAPLRGGLGLGRQLPLPLGQTGRQPPGRHP